MRRWQTVIALIPFVGFSFSYMGHMARSYEFVAAADRGDTEAVQAGLEEGLGADSVGNHGRTALEYAAFRGRTDIVRLLLKNEADPERTMAAAMASDIPRIVVTLAGAGAHLSGPQGVSALCSAAAQGDCDTVRALMYRGIDINAHRIEGVKEGETGMTPILYAARSGSWKTFQILADRGANLRAQSDDGKTALIYAEGTGTPDSAIICRYLIHHGADVNATDDQGETALSVAMSSKSKGARDMQAVLLQNGAKIK